MALTIATNVSSLNTQRWLNVSASKQGVSLERLSSGYKINSASDDAAGYAISNKLSIKSASITKAIDNGNQGVAMLQTAASGLQTIADMLTRLKELATEASSDNNATDRDSLEAERAQLEAQITNIVNGTKYGATALLSGGGTAVTVNGANLIVANGIDSISSNSSAAVGTYTITTTAAAAGHSTITVDDGTNSQVMEVDIPAAGGHTAISFAGLGITVNVNSGLGSAAITAGNDFDVAAGATTATFQFQVGDTNSSENQISVTLGGIALQADLGLGAAMATWTNDELGRTAALAYLNQVDVAIGVINGKAAGIGAAQNRIDYQIQNLEATQENTKAATSTIKDVDYASEMSDFTSSQIQTQAGIAMLTQANQLPQQILSLLKQ
jgi:flagellin